MPQTISDAADHLRCREVGRYGPKTARKGDQEIDKIRPRLACPTATTTESSLSTMSELAAPPHYTIASAEDLPFEYTMDEDGYWTEHGPGSYNVTAPEGVTQIEDSAFHCT